MSNVGDNTADDEDDDDYYDDDVGCSDGCNVRYPALVMIVLMMMMALITMIMQMPMAIENVIVSRETPRFSINNMCICISVCCRERPRDLAHTE